MLANKFVSYAIIFIFLFERMLELVVNHFNKAYMVNKHFARVKFPREAVQMRIFHVLWFISLIIETYFRGRILIGFWFYYCVFVLIMAQTLRWYAIYTLGAYWSVDVYELKEHPLIVSGPYAYLRHPNYLAVVVEFVFLPLLLGCPLTLIFGTLANLLILRRRIVLEEEALSQQSIM